MVSETPLVSVLMPVYNSEAYLSAAIDSILAQTFTNFELIAVNDGSTDNGLQILECYNQRDRRLRVFSQENQGIPATRNKCLDLATGKYVAWMDSDDLSLPTRLEKQVAFMKANPVVGVCGTWAKIIGGPRALVWRFKEHDCILRSLLIFNPPFANSSTMMRLDVSGLADLRFDESFAVSQDYEFWERAARSSSFANLQEVLVLYRRHPNQVSSTQNERQIMFSGRVRRMQIVKLGIEPSEDEFAIHQRLSQFDFDASRDFLTGADAWLARLHDANIMEGIFPEPAFSHVLAERWFLACRAATKLGTWTWDKYWMSPLSKYYNMKLQTKAKFLVFSSFRLSS